MAIRRLGRVIGFPRRRSFRYRGEGKGVRPLGGDRRGRSATTKGALKLRTVDNCLMGCLSDRASMH
jgi:hypothetical protein